MEELQPGDVVRFKIGNFLGDWLCTQYEVDPGWPSSSGIMDSPTLDIRFKSVVGDPDVKTITPIGPDTPAAALAMAVLAGSDGAVPALIEAAAESLRLEPFVDVQANAEKLAAEVRGVPDEYGIRLPNPQPLYDKLRSLGYGKAVDELQKTAFGFPSVVRTTTDEFRTTYAGALTAYTAPARFTSTG